SSRIVWGVDRRRSVVPGRRRVEAVWLQGVSLVARGVWGKAQTESPPPPVCLPGAAGSPVPFPPCRVDQDFRTLVESPPGLQRGSGRSLDEQASSERAMKGTEQNNEQAIRELERHLGRVTAFFYASLAAIPLGLLCPCGLAAIAYRVA